MIDKERAKSLVDASPSVEKSAYGHRNEHDRDAFTHAKTDFIKRITGLARAEAQKNTTNNTNVKKYQ